MKRMLIVLVAVALLMMYIVPAHADIPSTMYVVNCKEWVSLRATPHKDADRLAKVPLGAKVTNCHQQGKDWIYCEYGGKAGYVLAEYLAAEASSSKDDKSKGEKIGSMYVVNCDEWVSLRATPSTSAERVAKIPLGTKLSNCIRHDKKWIYCEYGGKAGFVLSKYLTSSISSWAKDQKGKGDSMYVVNCDEWVSLRESPSKSADRLRKVPLGAKVTNCVKFDKSWFFCKYDGKYGFVLAEYLSKSAPSEEKKDKKDTAPSAPNEGEMEENASVSEDVEAEEGYGDAQQPAVSELGGYTLQVERTYPNESETVAVNVSKDGEALWARTVSLPYISELDGICVFMGGTEADPRVMIYAEDKLESVYCESGETAWTLDRHLGGSCSWAVADDGTMYIGGYYGPDPVAITMDGAVLWASDANGAYWLYELELADEGLVATYEMAASGSENEEKVCFDYVTGAVLSREEIAQQQ